jgi:hypothetical protein
MPVTRKKNALSRIQHANKKTIRLTLYSCFLCTSFSKDFLRVVDIEGSTALAHEMCIQAVPELLAITASSNTQIQIKDPVNYHKRFSLVGPSLHIIYIFLTYLYRDALCVKTDTV